MDRRRFLRLSGVGLAAAAAGCGQDDGEDTAAPGDDGGGDGETPTPTATSTTVPAETTDPGATPTASPTAPSGTGETPTPSPTPEPTPSPTPTATPRQAAQVVAVADGALTFEPQVFEISTGDTVVWVWHSNGHNVRPSAIPRGSEFSGTPGDDGDLYEEGYEFSHTFEVAGEYEYYCNPHESAGMFGSFTVTE
ncbi:plastocyanin/azurin family copper-binding protein [Halosimplex salinum]|uniref:plastocyanin/azurin family copper-binding protein n=1 Tax=Halosimplex salinum TaxID=1710538 RepID=UPI000F486C52|nr:plastocyanin/azurin family copper-binding protein [Halosimplex salinum]